MRHLFSLLMLVLLPVALSSGVLAFETAALQAILIDSATGTVLLEKDSDVPAPPASLSKLMTSYMVFEEIKMGGLALDDMLLVSEKAWRMGGSKMFVEVGDKVSVEDLLRGVVVQSGNDACIVLAETIAGSEAAFSDLMTDRAHEMGMSNSTFTNSTGWPDPEHRMSPRDIAFLTQRIVIDFPEFFPYFAEKEFTYNGIRQGNRNPLLYKNIGADGMKTGYTKESGYSLAATALRNDRRLILVLTGLDSARQRAIEGERLLDYGFRKFNNYELFTSGETVESADVWLGDFSQVPLVIEDTLTVTLPRDSRDKLQVSVVFESPIPAPVKAGEIIATLLVETPDTKSIELPLIAGKAVPRAGPFRRISGALSYMLFGPSLEE
ncbi:MAG: D-alanyl-D-alanine carboxypeptidase DacC [Alphaproteobacteria bacterium MarineAlpha9_Bin5]|nr:MAG: D-alanyl-D-alanine carboxypeptidase DacC [Alphaproteobacteria bacterium MarineAlpha9_Bin6]PPR36995.1 MAG: D-alanyl-D-alanine carboxypeptidase DacC [Alphaproteobacteria bacterium MarineAlpha9_Bin5]HIA22397.1 D-alanyl-D-alanine carboxypeptidase [Alphaproteobacteria bacterium]HIB55945.1 D-alanyl-D-alanine carboxypeptidase [Alphaproteobacteria bacterium]HIN91702.1 D-alanyl-D-alanine carboxypeptidase [Alphaproteobacteria bacterium]